jgi:hypothetical protein
MAKKGDRRTSTVYIMDGSKWRSCWNGESWRVTNDVTKGYLCSVWREGSNYIASGFPGKRWGSIRQAIQYTLTMRAQDR